MTEHRSGVITFKGGPMTLVGPEIKTGSKAPDFKVVNGSLESVDLAATSGKVRILSVVPSLDTPVCEQQTVRFNEEAGKLPEGIDVYTISLDLPFAQNRFCGAKSTDRVIVLSDYQDRSFAEAYGVLIDELKLLTRAIFVLDKDDTVRHVEYVSEVTDHPNYDAALEAARSLA